MKVRRFGRTFTSRPSEVIRTVHAASGPPSFRTRASRRAAQATTQPEGRSSPALFFEEIRMNRKTPGYIGAIVGLALFFTVAFAPSRIYGGYVGVLLAGGIVGTPVHPTFLVRALVAFGTVLGVLGVASLFAVAGAALGAGVLALTGAVRRASALVVRERCVQERD